MTQKERLQTETTAAMRSGDALRRDVLRMASNALYMVEKREGRPLTQDEETQVLSREVKTRRESVEAYQAARPDGPRRQGARRDRDPVRVPAGRPERRRAPGARCRGISATGASSPRELGKVMGWLAPRTRGRADGKRVSELVAQGLASADLAAHDAAASH